MDRFVKRRRQEDELGTKTNVGDQTAVAGTISGIQDGDQDELATRMNVGDQAVAAGMISGILCAF